MQTAVHPHSALHCTHTMRRLVVLTTAATLALASTGGLNDTLLWGAYRPGLYFGLRPRIPQSLMTGLIWFGTQDFQAFTGTRVTMGCTSESSLWRSRRDAACVRPERQDGHVYVDRVRPATGRCRNNQRQTKQPRPSHRVAQGSWRGHGRQLGGPLQGEAAQRRSVAHALGLSRLTAMHRRASNANIRNMVPRCRRPGWY